MNKIPKIGEVAFFKGSAIYMRAVRLYNILKYGKPGFSHVGIIGDKNFKDDGYDVLVYEAIGSGFEKNWYRYSDIVTINPKVKLINVKKNCEKYLGVDYGWKDILAIVLSIFGINIKTTGASKLICSEAVARILYESSNKKINFENEYYKPYDLITPMDIFNSTQL